MPESRTAAVVFEQEFLLMRAKLLEVAAALDRCGRAEGMADDDPRWQKIRESIRALLEPDNDRAEQLQLIFSHPYDDEWQAKLGIRRQVTGVGIKRPDTRHPTPDT